MDEQDDQLSSNVHYDLLSGEIRAIKRLLYFVAGAAVSVGIAAIGGAIIVYGITQSHEARILYAEKAVDYNRDLPSRVISIEVKVDEILRRLPGQTQ
jgi:hypothetical protein